MSPFLHWVFDVKIRYPFMVGGFGRARFWLVFWFWAFGAFGLDAGWWAVWWETAGNRYLGCLDEPNRAGKRVSVKP